MRIRPECRIVASMLLTVLFIGCGKSSDLHKVTVEGKVYFDGEPIANGEIRFRPVEGTPGPVSGAPIVDGHYRAVAKGGVPVGKQLVQIEAYDVSSGSSSSEDMVTGGRVGARVNYLPSKYHSSSQLTINVTGDKKVMTQDFDLAK